MGAGKSTFARGLLKGLGFRLPPEGSPTFAIAHEYEQSGIPRTIHLDLYRIESTDELEAAGIPSTFWNSPDSIILSEWTSKFAALEEALFNDPRHDRWRVDLQWDPNDSTKRRVHIHRFHR